MDVQTPLEALRQLDPEALTLEEARQGFLLLLALSEQLLAEQRLLRSAVADLQQQLARRTGPGGPGAGRRKGGGGGKGGGAGGAAAPGAAPSAPPPPARSSEAERRAAEGRKPWQKSAKRDTLFIDLEVPLFPDLGLDAEDWVFERYETVVVQDLVLTRRNTRFVRARFRSRTTGASVLAPLPPGYRGQFGPGIRSLALCLGYGANVSMPLLQQFFQQAGCMVSRGQVSRFLTEHLERFAAEAAAAIRAAVEHHPWLQIDDTRSGVRTEHGCCHVLGNDLATCFKTTDRGDRRSVVEALFLGAPLTYCLNEQALQYLERWRVARWVRNRLAARDAEPPTEAAEFARWLDLRLPTLSAEQREQVLTAAALAGYHDQTEIPRILALLSDDASVFHGLVDAQALCWIHDFRHYLDLVPTRPLHDRQFQRCQRRYWQLYRQLLAYRAAPTPAKRARIEKAFDQLVDAQQAPEYLASCLARTRKNRAKLLLVLEHPELPLHNNAEELAVRRRVRKRDVSFGPVSAAGRQAWDTFQGLAATAAQLGISFWSYVTDRIHEAGEIPPLAEIIAEKAAAEPRPSSWITA